MFVTSEPRAEAVSSETIEARRPQVLETRCGENNSTSFLRLFLTGRTTITSIFSSTSRKLVMPIRFSSVCRGKIYFRFKETQHINNTIKTNGGLKNPRDLVSPCGPPAGGSGEQEPSHSLCWLVWPVNAATLLRHMQWGGWRSVWQRCCTELT